MPELPHTDSPDPFPMQSTAQLHGLSALSPGFAEKINAFHDRVIGAKSPLIMTHDYPDPDCIASGYGVSHLLSFWGMENSIISFGGFVGRAENRAMIRYLNIRTIPFVLLEIKDYDCIIVVDCFPGNNNVSLPAGATVNAVLDHHRVSVPENPPFFHDVRPKIGATSTIVTEYLLGAGCPVPPKLATGLFYGIMTDTGDMGRDSSAEDLECYKILFDRMDHRLLSQIEHPDRDAEFFKVLHRATKSMAIYDTIGYVHLGQVTSPDYVGEMVDLFNSLEKIEITICSGIFKKNIFFSIRSKIRDEAGACAEKIGKALGGGGGGHGKAGAGRIPFVAERGEEIIATFISLFKDAFNIPGVQGVSIV
jgi:nanoRNase/pAp phosphatase (c-di-AMP/oligoRNAs hydrolase)